MGINARGDGSSGSKFLAPQGTWIARCYSVIDLGYILNKHPRQDGGQNWQRKIRVAWELPNNLMDDGSPFSVSFRYTLSLDDRSYLYQHLVSWRGKAFTEEELHGFDITKLIGVPCQIQVLHNGEYANVNAVLPLGNNECPNQINPTLLYSIDDDPNGSDFEALPDWVKTQFGEREEPFGEIPQENFRKDGPDEGDNLKGDSDIPF